MPSTPVKSLLMDEALGVVELTRSLVAKAIFANPGGPSSKIHGSAPMSPVT